jgi:hypothetical protein
VNAGNVRDFGNRRLAPGESAEFGRLERRQNRAQPSGGFRVMLAGVVF